MEEYQKGLLLAQLLLKTIHEKTDIFVTVDPLNIVYQDTSTNPHCTLADKIAFLQTCVDNFADELFHMMTKIQDIKSIVSSPLGPQRTPQRTPQKTSQVPKPKFQFKKKSVHCERCRLKNHVVQSCRAGPPTKPCYCGASHWIYDCPLRYTTTQQK